MPSTLEQIYQKYKDSLLEWEKFLGLPSQEPERSEIELILTLSRDELRQLSNIDISECAFMLSQYALFLQQKSNECQAFLSWADVAHNKVLQEDKSKLIIWIRNVNTRSIRMAYLTRRIEVMVQSLHNLNRSRYNTGKDS